MKVLLFIIFGALLLGGIIFLSYEKPVEAIDLCDEQPTFGLPYVFESIPQAEFYIEQRAITLRGCD